MDLAGNQTFRTFQLQVKINLIWQTQSNQSTSSPSRPATPSCPAAPLDPWKITWRGETGTAKSRFTALVASQYVAFGCCISHKTAPPYLLWHLQIQLVPGVRLCPVRRGNMLQWQNNRFIWCTNSSISVNFLLSNLLCILKSVYITFQTFQTERFESLSCTRGHKGVDHDMILLYSSKSQLKVNMLKITKPQNTTTESESES